MDALDNQVRAIKRNEINAKRNFNTEKKRLSLLHLKNRCELKFLGRFIRKNFNFIISRGDDYLEVIQM